MPAVLWIALVWLGLSVLVAWALARWFRWLRDGDEVLHVRTPDGLKESPPGGGDTPDGL